MCIIPGLGALLLGLGSIELTHVVSQGANANSITLSASIEDGDLIVVLGVAANNGNNCTDNMPGDFTRIYRESGGVPSQIDHNAIAYVKKAEASDASRLITVINGDGEGIVVFVFRPSSSFSTIEYSSWTFEYQASTQPATQTVDVTPDPGTPLVVIGMGATNGVPSFTTASPAFDGTQVSGNNTFIDIIGGYKIYNTSPADHSIRSADNTSFNMLLTGWIRVY